MTDTYARLVAKHGANDFGMPLLDRDSDHDWWNQRDDLPVADLTVSGDRLNMQVKALLGENVVPTRVQNESMRMDSTEEVLNTLVNVLKAAGVIELPNLVADLDMSAPAKLVRRVTEGWTTPISRQPDFYDADMAWWVGEHGTVGYDVEHYAKAALVASDHGYKVRQGVLPDEFGLVVVPHGDTFEAGMGARNLAYTLWTIAEQAVS